MVNGKWQMENCKWQIKLKIKNAKLKIIFHIDL